MNRNTYHDSYDADYLEDLDFEDQLLESQGTGDRADSLEDISMIDFDHSDGQGDQADPYEEFYIDRRFNSGSSDSNGAFRPNVEARGDLDWEEEMEASECEEYVPISQLLANENLEREDWYDSPDADDFRKAFACLSVRKQLAKKYLLEMLNPCDDEYVAEDDPDLETSILKEVNYTLSAISIPSLARQSVEKLCDLLIEHPSLDLRRYLLGLDVFTVAYVIWGIDFYMNKKCLNITDRDGTVNEEIDSVQRSSKLTGALRETLNNSFGWLTNTFSSIMLNSNRER